MFKKYLKEKKLSVYKLSELSKVPYTTLNELVNGKKTIDDCKVKTIESIAVALKCSIETVLRLLNNKSVYLSNSWEENKNKKFYFPVIINNTNYDCRRIHPLMQKKISDIYEFVSNENIIEEVIIFGSCINIRCNQKSDIDIAIYIDEKYFTLQNKNKISEDIQEICDYNADIIWLNSIDKESQLYDNIDRKGLVIYEQITSKGKSKKI